MHVYQIYAKNRVKIWPTSKCLVFYYASSNYECKLKINAFKVISSSVIDYSRDRWHSNYCVLTELVGSKRCDRFPQDCFNCK